MKENILFHLPDDPEIAIAALSVIDSYIEQSQHKTQMAMQAKQESVEETIYLLGVPDLLKQYVDPQIIQVTERPELQFHLEFYFDPYKARYLGVATNKHVTDSFSIMLGIMQQSIFPKYVPRLQRGDEILLLNSMLFREDLWPGWLDLEDFLAAKYTDYKITKATNETDLDACVRQAAIVIGPRCYWTYLAAAMGRVVIEWYSDHYKDWLTKYENIDYRSINLDGGKELTATYVFRVLANKELLKTV